MNSKEFTHSFERKVRKTISDYGLCSKRDKILAACSGGKDSTTVLYLLNKSGYKVEGMMIDLHIGDWSKRNMENIKKFCKENKIKLNVVDIRKELGCSMCFIRSKVQAKQRLSNCMICGVIRKWLLNKKARELGATKLATGHNLDDGAETVLMNLLKGNLELNIGMGPETGIIKDRKFVPRIKPLYFCLNKDIKQYSKIKKFPVIYEPCPCRTESFRKKVRDELSNLEKKNPEVKENIVKTFLKILPLLKKSCGEEKINYCGSCGEPSRGKICRMCVMLR